MTDKADEKGGIKGGVTDPKADPKLDPKVDPRDPRHEGKADPRVDPSVDPRDDPKLDQERRGQERGGIAPPDKPEDPKPGDGAAAIKQLQEDNEKLQKDLKECRSQLRSAKVGSAKEGKFLGRKIGPVDPLPEREDDAGNVMPPAQVLLDMIEEGETVEVVFSDGERELEYAKPLEVTGDAWQPGSLGLKLTLDPIEIDNRAGPQFDIGGYGLVIDGEQVAWRATGPHKVAAGTTFNVAGDIIFDG